MLDGEEPVIGIKDDAKFRRGLVHRVDAVGDVVVIECAFDFDAVKTKGGQKKGVEPRAGQRRVNSKLPSGATFDGNVQAMGFRFKTEKLVVPMRLSAFNGGRLRNIVYLLTDSPQRIRSIPEEYVVRQVAGVDLFQNATGPLPLRIIGGTEADIPAWRRKTLAKERNPGPHNGAARDLFASDLQAVSSGQLALAHEEREKELLAIGERFGLRGKEVDGLNAKALEGEREKTVAKGLDDLKKTMTLTVVDGDFPREVLAKQNLAFDDYRMPARRNRAETYDAKKNGPGGRKQGVLKVGALDPLDAGLRVDGLTGLGLLGLVTVGLGVVVLRRRGSRCG